MKFYLAIYSFYILTFTAFGQSDSLKEVTPKIYKNILKLDLFNVPRGMNTLSYERSITSHSSVGVNYQFILSGWEIEKPQTYSMYLNLRYQFYFSKKKRNKGFYLFGQTGLRYAKNYSKYTIEYFTPPSKEIYAYNYRNITLGLGLGYQWFIKKRLTFGLELLLTQFIYGQKQYVTYLNNEINKYDWKQTDVSNNNFLRFFIHLGYRF
jgi:hypothetical protein